MHLDGTQLSRHDASQRRKESSGMRIHHLNCGSMCPLGRRLLNGEGGWTAPAHLCCHCLLIESRNGLILVDTGLGTRDITHPQSLGWHSRASCAPAFRCQETAVHQIRELGLDPRGCAPHCAHPPGSGSCGGAGRFPASPGSCIWRGSQMLPWLAPACTKKRATFPGNGRINRVGFDTI